MGCHDNIGMNAFPRQGRYLGATVRVCFHYDTKQILVGRVIRDDEEDPGVMMIALPDERVVLATECQWSPL